jgi:hypothetical protein
LVALARLNCWAVAIRPVFDVRVLIPLQVFMHIPIHMFRTALPGVFSLML